MTTTEWEKTGRYWWADGVSCDRRDHGSGVRWAVGFKPERRYIAAFIDFEPSVAEARAVLRMDGAGNGDTSPEHATWDNPITREAVHAFIREHGSVEECEAIAEKCCRDCPGCGRAVRTAGGDRYVARDQLWWHTDCLARVRSRTEATPSGEPEPEWLRVGARVRHRYAGLTGIVNNFTDSIVGVLLDNGGFEPWSRSSCEPYAPAPVQPVEPRRFQVGDRVRWRKHLRWNGVVMCADVDKVKIRWSRAGVADQSIDYSQKRAHKVAVLVTPVQQDREAARDRRTDCTDCGEPLAGGDLFCRECCSCPEEALQDDMRCRQCGEDWSETRRTPTPYVHEGATDYGGNECGFPRMPERDDDFHIIHEAISRAAGTVIVADTSPHKADLWKSEPASVVLPFDAWLAARERAQQEPEPYDPREGDEVEVHVGDAPNYTGVFARFSEDGDLVVRYRDDGCERSVSVNPYCVTLVRRPGGVR